MKLYNTLSRDTDDFASLHDGAVKLYTCGLTVYSQPHIGNWCGYIYWDILVRTLQAEGYMVEHTQNITDVGHLTSDDDSGEDKMQKGAKREGITAWSIADKYSAIAADEAALLGLMPPTHLVRATDMIDEQIAFAKTLEAKGYLYKIPDDGIYFDTSKLPDYGKLARLDIAGLEAGARVPVAGKRNITDFAVWKFSHTNQKRDMEWDSPWGVGFPGWHLECSVIARETLGDQLDIHTGGIDHIPVHHTNEIAQTESLINPVGTLPNERKAFSRFWLHNNHLKADGRKMSKSLGNIYTLEDIQKQGFDMNTFKVFILGKHYRTEGNFTWDNLEAARNRLAHWREAAALRWQLPAHSDAGENPEFEQFALQLHTALANDLNTPRALQLIDEATDAALAAVPTTTAIDTIISVVKQHLGIDLTVPDISEAQKRLIAQRNQVRDSKDWQASDRLRDELAGQGIGLRDTPQGAVWYPMHSTHNPS